MADSVLNQVLLSEKEIDDGVRLLECAALSFLFAANRSSLQDTDNPDVLAVYVLRGGHTTESLPLAVVEAALYQRRCVKDAAANYANDTYTVLVENFIHTALLAVKYHRQFLWSGDSMSSIEQQAMQQHLLCCALGLLSRMLEVDWIVARASRYGYPAEKLSALLVYFWKHRNHSPFVAELDKKRGGQG